MFDFLGDLLGLNQGDPLIDAANQNKEIIGDYDKRGQKIIKTGYTRAEDFLRRGSNLYAPLSGATGMYADAIGLNGDAGAARATDAFKTAPGYDFQMNQGLQALDRRRAAAGSFQSGGADIDTMTYATGLADQAHSSWLDRLSGASSTALAGQSGAMNNLANLMTGTASQRLGLAGDVSSALLGVNNQRAEGESANKQGMAGLGGNLLGMAGKAFGWGGF